MGKLVNLSDLLVHDPLPGKAGHRPHPLGHPRRAHRGQRPPAPGRARSRSSTTASSRTSASCAPSWPPQGYRLRDRDRHRDRRAAGAAPDLDAGPAPARGRAARRIARLEGAFALALPVRGRGRPDRSPPARARRWPSAMATARCIVGSDAIALAPMTDRITYLEEGDRAVVTRAGVEIRDADGQRANRAVRTRRHRRGAGRQGRPQALHGQGDRRAARGAGRRAAPITSTADGGSRCPAPSLDFAGVDRVMMVACGTAFYACHDREILVRAARRRCRSRSMSPPSSATASRRWRRAHAGALRQPVGRDRRHAGRAALLPRQGAGSSRWSTSTESSIARESDLALPILAGPEIGVASTKAFTCQLTVLACLALKAAPTAAGSTPRRWPAACRGAAHPAGPDEPRAGVRADDIRAVAQQLAEARTSCSWAAARCTRWRWKAR